MELLRILGQSLDKASSSGAFSTPASTPAAAGTAAPSSASRDTKEQMRAWAYWT